MLFRSNSTRISRPEVAAALRKVDNNILKLDSAFDSTVRLLDRPAPGYSVERTIESLASFGRQGIIQTMFTRGEHRGEPVDNTTDAEVDALIDAYRRIAPGEIMIYTIDRPTPETSLQRIPRAELDVIADKIRRATGIEVQVSG